MKLKTAKYLYYTLCLLMVVCMLACSAAKTDWLAFAAIAIAFVAVLFWIIFGRCPCCNKFLWRSDGKYCPHCGEKLEW